MRTFPLPPGTDPADVPDATTPVRGGALPFALALTVALLSACAGLSSGGAPAPGATEEDPVATADASAGAEAGGDDEEAGQEDAGPEGEGPVPQEATEEDAGARTPDPQDYPSGPVYETDVDVLRSIGPAYTPYDVPPALQRGEYLEGLLRATLLPIIEKYDLPPDEWARFWVLVDANGRVAATRLHLTSGHAVFDDAAAAAAERLRYRPARRDGEPVPVWVLARISLLLG